MGLKDLITDLAYTAFVVADDLVQTVKIIEQTGNVYDPSTGQVTKTEIEHTISKAIFAQFTQKEMDKDDDINGTTDQKLIFPRKGLTFDLNDNDIVEDSTNNKWDIVKALGVPGDSVGIYHVRLR